MTVNNDKSGKASVKYDMTATGSFNVSGSKAWANGDDGVTYMFALPKSYTSKSYKGLDDLAEKVSKIANDNNGTLNTVNAYNQLHNLFMNISGAGYGYQTGSSNGAVFDMLDSSKDNYSFTVGSIGGSNSGEGKIEGYDILIYRDERVGNLSISMLNFLSIISITTIQLCSVLRMVLLLRFHLLWVTALLLLAILTTSLIVAI